MLLNELNKHKVDLSKRGCVPAVNFNGRWCCDYGVNGLAIVKHNYMTKNDAFISVFDVYTKGVYDCTFKTKKSALAYVELKDKKLSERN
jgi:hypothetical protein